jgi:hypothetical protein
MHHDPREAITNIDTTMHTKSGPSQEMPCEP